MYSIASYGHMITNQKRMEAYHQALAQTVKPGAIVLDIGTGTGIMALLACQLGAERVYAIEPSDAIGLAREVAKANGYADRIEFIQDISTQVTLARPADVIVSDLRGVLPLYEQHIKSIADARARLLAPGGRLIPQQDDLWVAVLDAPKLYEDYNAPWQEEPFGLDLQAGRRYVTNTWRKVNLKAEQVLTQPQKWATLDYTTIENPNLKSEISWTISRPALAHGLGVWFEATLAEGIGFSNAPGQPELIYGQAFFPWTTPVQLEAGDLVTVELAANLVGADYLWRWHSKVQTQNEVKADFKQSTFLSQPLATVRLRRQADSYVATLNPSGQAARLVLELMAEGKTLGQIAETLTAQFPQQFPTWQAALNQVGELSQMYSL